MSSFFFVWWRKERERMEMVAALRCSRVWLSRNVSFYDELVRKVSLHDKVGLSRRIGRLLLLTGLSVLSLIRSGQVRVRAQHLSFLITCKRGEHRACLMMRLIP